MVEPYMDFYTMRSDHSRAHTVSWSQYGTVKGKLGIFWLALNSTGSNGSLSGILAAAMWLPQKRMPYGEVRPVKVVSGSPLNPKT
jgi:hypothetical protein